MLDLSSQLQLIAARELSRLDIQGLVLNVCFVSDNSCPMMRIAFCSSIEPTPTLTGFNYIEKEKNEVDIWYLYCVIDTPIQVKQ